MFHEQAATTTLTDTAQVSHGLCETVATLAAHIGDVDFLPDAPCGTPAGWRGDGDYRLAALLGCLSGDVKHWPIDMLRALSAPLLPHLQSLDDFGHVIDDIQAQIPAPGAAPSYVGFRLVWRQGGGVSLSVLYRRLLARQPVAGAFTLDVIRGVDLMAIDDCAMTWTYAFKGKAYAQLATALAAIRPPRTLIASPIVSKSNAITKIIWDNRLIYLFDDDPRHLELDKTSLQATDRCTDAVLQLFLASRPYLGQAFHGQRRSMYQYGEDFTEFRFLAWDGRDPVFVTTHLQVFLGTDEVFRDDDLGARGALPAPVQVDLDEALMLQQLNPGSHVSVCAWAEGFRPLQLAPAPRLLAMVSGLCPRPPPIVLNTWLVGRIVGDDDLLGIQRPQSHAPPRHWFRYAPSFKQPLTTLQGAMFRALPCLVDMQMFDAGPTALNPRRYRYDAALAKYRLKFVYLCEDLDEESRRVVMQLEDAARRRQWAVTYWAAGDAGLPPQIPLDFRWA
jgi:hypothetical protein